MRVHLHVYRCKVSIDFVPVTFSMAGYLILWSIIFSTLIIVDTLMLDNRTILTNGHKVSIFLSATSVKVSYD